VGTIGHGWASVHVLVTQIGWVRLARVNVRPTDGRVSGVRVGVGRSLGRRVIGPHVVRWILTRVVIVVVRGSLSLAVKGVPAVWAHHVHWVTSWGVLRRTVGWIARWRAVVDWASPVEGRGPVLGVIIDGYGTCVKMCSVFFLLFLVVAGRVGLLNPVATGPQRCGCLVLTGSLLCGSHLCVFEPGCGVRIISVGGWILKGF